MRQLNLKNREMGPWAGFEREMIAAPHSGWVKFVGQRRIKLRKSPYLDANSKHSYILPEDIEVYDDELVDLDVGQKYLHVRSGPQGAPRTDDFDEYYIVEGLKKIELKLPRPHLDSNDFLERISINWKLADRDHLDRALALQILSCPESCIGPGGIGSQSFNLSSKSKPLDHLKSTILQNLPAEFSHPNPRYEFDFIEEKNDLKKLRHRVLNGDVEEASYNYLKMIDPALVPLPIQIPTIIYNSTYAPRSRSVDPDIIDYLLHALAIRPVVTEEAIKDIERSLTDVLELTEPAYMQFNAPFDTEAIAKIAMAICRMENRSRMDESSFSQSKDWFKEMYSAFTDLRLNYVRTGSEAKLSPWAQTSYMYGNLTKNDLIVLAEINKGVYQQGLDYISIGGLITVLKERVGRNEIMTSVARLNAFGHIVSRENDTLFKPIIKQDLIGDINRIKKK